MNQYWVYIMTNKYNSVFYIGVTNNLQKRDYEHKNKLLKGFTQRYSLTKLVFYEETSDVTAAISREKQLKGWTRAKKIALIESLNPVWEDLSDQWYRDPSLRSG